LRTPGFARDLHVSLSIFMIAFLLAVCAQAGSVDLVVTIAAEGPLTRTQPTALTLTADNVGDVALDDVTLTLALASDDAGVGLAPACSNDDDGERQTATCTIESLSANSSVALQVDIVPNQEGELRVELIGATSTPGEDASNNAIVGVFAVNPFVPPPPDDGDNAGGCSAAGAAASPVALAALWLAQSRTRSRGRCKPAAARASTR
jgi:hypothetical protein